jgi:hypothetical protein
MKKKFILTENQINNLKKGLIESRLRSYIFDWDDNILFMPTTIKMDKNENGKWVPVDVSTEEFAKVRTSPEYRLRNNNPDAAFKDFVDDEPFIEDATEAIHQGNFAPSADKFKEALTHGNRFAINTARGHKPKTLKRGVKLYIDMVFTDEEKEMMMDSIRKNLPLSKGLNDDQTLDLYLDDMGEYYPVSSQAFGERFGLEVSGGAANPEHAKKVAIEHFVKKVLENVKTLVDSGKYTKMSVGFSDDDLKNVRASEDFIENELKHMYPEFHFVVYDTSEGGKNKLIIQKEEN